MSTVNTSGHLPDYHVFSDNIAILALPFSPSQLHGMLCGYLCAGAFENGELYLRALIARDKKNNATRVAAASLFELYTLSKEQITGLDFEFSLLIPDETSPLSERAQAFSEWCEGFTESIGTAGIGYEQLEEEESREALQHLYEFAQLDYEELQVDEEDEKALMEVSEYARMAVLRLCSDIRDNEVVHRSNDTAH